MNRHELVNLNISDVEFCKVEKRVFDHVQLLKKENAELKDKVSRRNMLTKDLRKEIAELKEGLHMLLKCNTNIATDDVFVVNKALKFLENVNQ